MANLDRRQALVGAAALSAACVGGAEGAESAKSPPLVIAHRGASGERPEHTISAYRRAIEQGADFVEPDLVFTRDGVLVCRHENEISGTTDVAARPEFASRKVTRIVDGETVTGWFTEDFTLQELRTLGCRERLPDLRPGNTSLDGREPIPTFAEMLEFVRAESGRLGRPIGVYPETKHPSYFESLGLSHDGPLLDALYAFNFGTKKGLPVFIQSFETQNLRRLKGVTSIPLIQLVAGSGAPFDTPQVSYAQMLEARGLAEIATYASGIGVEKSVVLAAGPDGVLASTGVVARAHARGLAVHAWTFRAENYFLPPQWRRGEPAAPDFLRQRGDFEAELRAYFAEGVDGVFSDYPAPAVQVRNVVVSPPQPPASLRRRLLG